MKKLLFILLPVILLLSCSKDDDHKEDKPTYPKPEKGDLSVPSFTVTNPEYRREGDYLYFDFVRFEGDIQGFTKIDHNVFKANETKEYRLDMKLIGSVLFPNYIDSYYLAVKAGDSTEYIESAKLAKATDSPYKTLKLILNQGDIVSFHFTAKDRGRPSPIQNEYLEINFQELSSGQADFSSALDGFALKDFVKE